MKKLVFVTALVCGLGMTTGCKDDGGSDSGSSNSAVRLGADFDGTWKTVCEVNGSVSEQEVIVFTNNGATMDLTLNDYATNNCSGGATPDGSESFTGATVTDQGVSSVNGALKVQITIGSDTINHLFALDKDASPNTITVGNPDNCTGQDCTGSEYPDSLSNEVSYVKQ